MSFSDRRQFIASSLGGLAALSIGTPLFAQEKKAAKDKAPKDKAPKAPPVVSKDPLASLFLTWLRYSPKY